MFLHTGKQDVSQRNYYKGNNAEMPLFSGTLKHFLMVYVSVDRWSRRGTRKRFCCHMVHARLRKHINYPLSVRPIGFRNISTFFQFVRCPLGTYQRVFGRFWQIGVCGNISWSFIFALLSSKSKTAQSLLYHEK